MQQTHGDRVQAYHQALIESEAIHIAPDANHRFYLRNRQRSWVFVDHAEMLTDPDTARPLNNMFSGYIFDGAHPPSETILANVDSKSSPHLVGALAARHWYRQVMVNPPGTTRAERGNGHRFRLPNVTNEVDSIIIVDDVFTTGDTTAIKVADQLRPQLPEALADKTIDLVVALSRGDYLRNVRQLGAHGVRLHSFLDLKHVMGNYLDYWSDTLSEPQWNGIRSEFGIKDSAGQPALKAV